MRLRYDGGMKQIAVIGGGAAGLAAAVAAAQYGDPGAVQITIFEETDRVGKSILASGNGRCNFSNARVSSEDYHNALFVRQAMHRMPPEEIMSFFELNGLFWEEEREGRLYPLTNKASTVLDVLRFAVQDEGIKVVCGCVVHSVTPAELGYLVTLEDSNVLFFDAVIVACGGKVARSLLPPSYLYRNTLPVLGALATNTEHLRGVNNIRAHCAMEAAGQREVGEVLFRDYGISGIAAFNLSRFVRPGDTVTLDFFPEIEEADFREMVQERFSTLGHRKALEFCAGMFQMPLARALLRAIGVDPENPLPQPKLPAFAQVAKSFALEVKGVADARQCQVWRGGFDVSAFNPSTLESRHDKGLFMVGEALDVDGPCGGYNLHWAWTSGILAGRVSTQ